MVNTFRKHAVFYIDHTISICLGHKPKQSRGVLLLVKHFTSLDRNDDFAVRGHRPEVSRTTSDNVLFYHSWTSDYRYLYSRQIQLYFN